MMLITSIENDHFKYEIIISVSTQLQAAFDVQVITGDIMFQAGGGNTIEELSLETTTGSIYATLENSYFPFENTINILKTVTGHIDTQFWNILSEGDIYWNINTVTGSIYSHLNQIILPEKNLIYYLDLAVVTGEIEYFFDFNNSPDIGYFFNSEVVTGQIVINGFSTVINLPYFSPYFDTAILIIDSTLKTTTGSITIVKG